MEKSELESHFSTITNQLQSITTSLSSLDTRVTGLENTSGIGHAGSSLSAQNSQFPPNHAAAGATANAGQGGGPSDQLTGTSASYDIVQHEFRKLQDKYLKTYLEPESKLHIERTGFRGEEARKLTVVHNCTKYSETILKIISASPSDTLDKTQTEEIAICATAQQSYLQGVYANLVVHSNFDAQTAKLFSQLQKNTSAFPPSLLPTLQSAASISAASNPPGNQRRDNQSSSGRNNNYNRNGGYNRGNNYNNYGNRNRNNYQYNRGGRDPYHTNSSFPNSRPEDNPDQ